MGHNLRGQKNNTWQAEPMMRMWGYYADDSQENSHKQQTKQEIVHHLVRWEGIQYDPSSYCGCLQRLLAKQA